MNHALKRTLNALGTSLLVLSMAGTVPAAPVVGQGTWESTLQGRDLDGDLSTAEAYYDTVLDITWLANADLAGADLTWANANDPATLSVPNVYGLTDWRLPLTRPLDGIIADAAHSNLGTEDRGHNVSAPGTPNAGSTASEMAHLYYNTLGNLSPCHPLDSVNSSCITQDGSGLTNTGPFTSLQAGFYWSASEFTPNTASAWAFDFNSGNQGRGPKTTAYAAWAVHDGPVGMPVVINNPPVAIPGAVDLLHPGTPWLLDGSGSTDVDEHYPLTYAWTLIESPPGATPELANPGSANPSFTAYQLGEYTLQLVVTDSLGMASAPATIVISTSNTAPLADAGPDQVIEAFGQAVQLDGGQSDDSDGDELTSAAWTFTGRPPGSAAALDDPTSLTPRFTPDAYGTYTLQLVVTDEFGATSEPASVTVTFNNAKPVALAGENQSRLVGDTVLLDGTASSDANGDPLTYSWSFASMPPGSSAAFVDPTAPQTDFVADVAGSYTVGLVVNDGLINSDPSTLQVVVSADSSSVTDLLQQAIDTINAMPLGRAQFANRAAKHIMTKKLTRAIHNVDHDRLLLAKIQVHLVLRRLDGCADFGVPDRNDWLNKCVHQNAAHPLLETALDMLQAMP